MIRSALFTAATVAILTSATAANAESYISLGIGDASTSGAIESRNATEGVDGDSYHIALGQRFGTVALEASLDGADFDDGRYSTTTAMVALKIHVPIAGPVEVYGKGGLNKTWDSDDLSGRGHALGLGLQLNLNTTLARAALFVDYTHVSTELGNKNLAIDGGVGLATIGATIGF